MSKHKLTHPDSKQSVEVTDEHLEMYKSQGWAEADEKSTEKPDPKN